MTTEITPIPVYVLCEDGKTKVPFRAPTVADYRAFCGLSMKMEEAVTTDWLDRLLIDKEQSSANWTAQDRRTALWWIYIHTRQNTVITQSYKCSHCDQTHGRQFDIVELGAGLSSAGRSMMEPIDMPGVKSGAIVPLRGYAMQAIEMARNERDELDPDSAEYEQAHADMRIKEAAASLVFDDEPKGLEFDDLLSQRLEYLMTLDLERQFKPLLAKIALVLRDMHHGLATTYHEGDVSIITPDHTCPVKQSEAKSAVEKLMADGIPESEWPDSVKEGNTAYTSLLLTFQCYQFFPDL
jgi:hypothetical protein